MVFGDNLRLADGQLEAFAAHLLDEDGQRELATALDLPGVRALGGEHLDGDVTDQFLVQAVLDLAGGDLGALDLAGQRRGVDTDGHGDGRVVDRDQRQRLRVVDVGQGLTDGDVLDTGDGDDLAGAGGLGRDTVEGLGGQQFGDLDVLQLAVGTCPGNGLALAQGAVVDAQQREAAEERRGVQVGDVRLQDTVRVVGRGRDVLDDGLEQRLEVLVVRSGAVGGLLEGGAADLGGGVDDGDVEDLVQVKVRNLVGEVGGQAQEQVHGLVDDFFDPRVGAVGLVDQEDHRQVRGEGLAQHEAGLGQRALGSVDEEDDAVDHGQAALDLATEVGVAGGVDDVDGDGLAVGGRSVVGHRGVLGQDGDALFALQVAGVHGAVFEVVVRGEGVGLLEHGVDQGGLAVVNVGDDRDVAQVTARCSGYRGVGGGFRHALLLDSVVKSAVVSRHFQPERTTDKPFWHRAPTTSLSARAFIGLKTENRRLPARSGQSAESSGVNRE